MNEKTLFQRLTAREVHCEVVALDGATIKLVREAVRLDARPEQLRVACYGADFTITRGSEVVKAEMTVRNDDMRDAIRQLGTIELELTYGARTYRGRARDFNWS